VMAMGKGGQISSVVFAGVLPLQARSKCRCPGDAKTIRRHLRHTCTRVSHHHVMKYS
jgi:hypothetical protein